MLIDSLRCEAHASPIAKHVRATACVGPPAAYKTALKRKHAGVSCSDDCLATGPATLLGGTGRHVMKTRMGMGLAAISVAALIATGCTHGDGNNQAAINERDAALAQLKTARDALAAARTDLAAARTDLAATNASLTTAQAEIAAKQGEIDTLTMQVTDAETARDAAQAALSDAMAAGDPADTATITRLTAELAAANATLTTVRASLAAANATLTTVRASLAAASTDRAALRSQVATLTARVSTLEMELAEARMDDAREPDEPEPVELTLERTGGFSSSSRALTQIINGVVTQVTEQSVQISGWGYWGKKGEDTLFRASLTATGTLTNGVPSQSYSSSVTGRRSGSNPTSGSAVWTGGVRGVTEGFTRVTGESRLEVDLGAATLDVDFTNFDDGRADMNWDGLGLTNGAFADGARLSGTFYGTEHDGAAGKFDRDSLKGVFGALRE